MNSAQKLALVILLGSAACNTGDHSKIVLPNKNDGLVKINLTDLNQQAINLEKYKGKTVFINFWATWCKPCIQEMPSIANAQNILRDEEIVFLLASDESIEQIEEFSIKQGYKFNYTRIENSEALDIQALPTTFIFSPGGSLVFSEPGERKWDDAANINMIREIIKRND
ncbi:MAG: TlpA disulfide reductase family protein [Daejeonella sp.]|uniref:TlpA family protein disulfide reductase n=1 Tax=Daejeonella sp. TaxID=2805397 RepID=UPI0033546639